jgi:hypothetical protein
MKVLMITEKDAANFSLTNIANAFIRKGHSLEIYAPYRSENAMRMFDKNIPVHPIESLTEQKAGEFDCIFASAFVSYTLKRLGLLQIKKYIFTYDFLIHGDIVDRMDFGFSPSINNTTSPFRDMMHTPLVGVGEPRFDSLDMSAQPQTKQILFIDSGHYPFGEEGKKELSRTLIDMARRYPEYDFVVKPRFLPSDDIVTHRNSLHLYDVLARVSAGTQPGNLILLKEHRNMEELINSSRTVMCLYTTAYITALAAQKGLIILDGLPNDDNCDLRVKRLNQTRTGMLGTGAVIHYKDAIDFLPNGVTSPKEHLNREILLLNGVSDTIVDIVTDVVCRHIVHGEFPVAGHYRYDEPIEFSKGQSWDSIVSRRLMNSLTYFIVTKFDYYVHADLDLRGVEERIAKMLKSGETGGGTRQKLDMIIKDIQNQILVQYAEEMSHDEVDQGILLQAYDSMGMHESITRFSNKTIGAYLYFAGQFAFNRNEFSQARRLLSEYLNMSLSRVYKKEITDDKSFHLKAYSYLGRIEAVLGNKAESIAYLGQYIAMLGEDAQKKGLTKERLYRDQIYAQFFCKWQEVLAKKGLNGIVAGLGAKKVMIYGAGSITEDLLMSLEAIKEKTVALVDRYCAQPMKCGVEVIKPEAMVHYPDVKTVIVAVPHLYLEIFRDLHNIREDLILIKVDDLLDLGVS